MKSARFAKLDDLDGDMDEMLAPQQNISNSSKRISASDFFASMGSAPSTASSTPFQSPAKPISSKIVQPHFVQRGSFSSAPSPEQIKFAQRPIIDLDSVSVATNDSSSNTTDTQRAYHELQYAKLRAAPSSTYVRKTNPPASATTPSKDKKSPAKKTPTKRSAAPPSTAHTSSRVRPTTTTQKTEQAVPVTQRSVTKPVSTDLLQFDDHHSETGSHSEDNLDVDLHHDDSYSEKLSELGEEMDFHTERDDEQDLQEDLHDQAVRALNFSQDETENTLQKSNTSNAAQVNGQEEDEEEQGEEEVTVDLNPTAPTAASKSPAALTSASLPAYNAVNHDEHVNALHSNFHEISGHGLGWDDSSHPFSAPQHRFLNDSEAAENPLGFVSRCVPRSLREYSGKNPSKCFYMLCVCAVFGALVLAVILLAVRYDVLSNKYDSLSSQTNSDGESVWAPQYTQSTAGMVATDVATCSRIGRDVLGRGGNAVDAAIASTLCVGVLSPASSGIGGGCYALIHVSESEQARLQARQDERRSANQDPNQDEVVLVDHGSPVDGKLVSTPTNISSVRIQREIFIDAREVAPNAAYETMFESNPLAAQNGGLAVAVLGEVKGLHTAYTLYGSGKIAWRDLVEPTAKIAESWTISRQLSLYIQDTAKLLLSGEYPALSALYLKQKHGVKTLKVAGDVVKQPELAYTLRQIGLYGPDYLHRIVAPAIAKEVQDAGGILTAEDLSRYAVTLSEPLKMNISGYQFVSVGGSSSGGIVVMGLLRFMHDFAEPLYRVGELYYHRLVEAMKHVFAMRLSLGDPHFVDVRGVYGAFLSEDYVPALRRERYSDDKVQALLEIYGGTYNMTSMTLHDAGTTHIAVVDRDGNAVSLTSTVNTYFGSKVVSPSTGILFNNQMDDFSVPGAANYFGLAPSPLNYPQPGKKPLSSMSPSLLLDKDGRLRLVGGASGGPKIITATAQVFMNYMFRGMDILSAVVSPRVHSQLLPDRVQVEDRVLFDDREIVMPATVFSLLESKGHQNVTHYGDLMGVSQFIVVDPDTGLLEGVSDPRKDGHPAGIV